MKANLLLLFILSIITMHLANAQKNGFVLENPTKFSKRIAQKKGILPTIEDCPPKMSNEAYTKFIKDEVTYTVLNQNSTVSGLKFDLGKTELTGTLRYGKDKKSSWIKTVDFTFGVNSDGVAKLFDNEKLSTKVAITPSFHWIPTRSLFNNSKKSIFLNRSWWVRGYDFEKCYAKSEITEKKDEIEKQRLELLAIALIATEQRNNPAKDPKLIEALVQIIDEENQQQAVCTLFQNVVSISSKSPITFSNEESQALVGAIKAYCKKLNGSVNIDDMYSLGSERLIFDHEKIYKDFKEKLVVYNQSEEVMTDFEITKLEKFHSYGGILRTWFTIAPIVSFEPVSILEKDLSVTTKHFNSSGLKFIGNIVKRSRESYTLNRIGASINFVSNLSGLKTKSYEKDTFNIKNNNLEIYSKETLTGYPAELIKKYKAGLSISYEFFKIKTKRTFMPGVFSNVKYSNNPLLKEEDKSILALEFGLVFNVSAQDKSKVYLLPYLGFPNVLEKNKDNKVFGTDWFLGLKVGLPFNLKN